MSMKYSTETIRNRTCDLPSCSTVPQPNAPPCVYVCAYLCMSRFCVCVCVDCNVKVIVYETNYVYTSTAYLVAVLIVVAYELQKHFIGIKK